MRIFSLLFIALIIVSCNNENSALNKFSDPVIQHIGELKDHRSSDSLYQYFDVPEASYRTEAALAFGSIQDTTAADRLAALLKDNSEDVRIAAAFALGQTPSSRGAMYLMEALPKEKVAIVRDEIFESIGKTIGTEQLPSFLATEYPPTRGYSWCLYRIALRRMADSVAVAGATPMLDEKLSDRIRLGAAFFFRMRLTGFDLPVEALTRMCLHDPSANVRMAATLALRNIDASKSFETLQKVAKDDSDYRVKVNAINVLGSQKSDESRTAILDALDDVNMNVKVAASEAVLASAVDYDSKILLEKAHKSSYWRVRSNLFHSVLEISQDTVVINELKNEVKTAEDVYAQSGYLNALGNSPSAAPFVYDRLMNSEVPVVRSSAAAALIAMNYSKFFEPSQKVRFGEMYRNAMQLADLAVIGTVASALMDSTLGYREFYKDHTFLFDAKKKLSLPKDNEALQTLEKAIAYFEGTNAKPVVNEYNHPIDWDLVKSISKDQRVRIRTSKGDIVIHLLVEDAPGSVANFVKLAQENYFDLKTFHRVVPNFVIQGGCNRGDGWGSEDYSIRSEFSPVRYKEGSVGMASAGKDTEGTQWFITHSPTPHLDGRYTIFAEVVTGMRVVHEIQVGDLIQSVELLE